MTYPLPSPHHSSLLAQSTTTTNVLAVTVDSCYYTYSGHFIPKESYSIYPLRLASFTLHTFFKVLLCCSKYLFHSFFNCRIIFHCMIHHSLIIYSLADGLGHLPLLFWYVMNNTAMNNWIQVFIWTSVLIFLGITATSRITGSCSNSKFAFLKSYFYFAIKIN